MMTRLCLALLLAAALPSLDGAPLARLVGTAQAQDSAKEAFEAAKELGTAEAWEAFLKSFPKGFYADLARAYLKKLAAGGAPSSPAAPAAAAARQGGAQAGEVALGANASLGGRRLLPDDNPWNTDISKAPVDPNSRRILARIGLEKTLRADFGADYEGEQIGIPYVVVGGNQKKVPMTFTHADESDAGPYPVPPDAPIEGGPNGTGDRHILVLDRDNWRLYELYNAFPDRKGGWKADSGAIWNLKENQVRPPRWTSADAAGLPILPGLVRYDEAVEKGAIEHALRFTVSKTRRAYVPPASHWASEAHDENLPPMGMRVRLKADYDISGFAPEVQAILQAVKTYGMIVADNGSDGFISGAPDQRWDNDILRELMRVKMKDLEVVRMDGIVTDTRRR